MTTVRDQKVREDIARAAGADAANRQMRAEGRTDHARLTLRPRRRVLEWPTANGACEIDVCMHPTHVLDYFVYEPSL